jgi:hypothetical protein
VNNKKWRNAVSLFKSYYLITLVTYQCSQRTPNVKINFFMFDWSTYKTFVLNRRWKRNSLKIMIFVNVCSTWSVVQIKTRFETSITRIDVYCVCMFLPSYLITLNVYLCSQWTPNVQIKNFMFDWSILRLFVLNTAWKRDSLQMMIFVTVCSTWRMSQLKKHFQTWITRNDINGVN